jgi:chromosome segregation ATPase
MTCNQSLNLPGLPGLAQLATEIQALTQGIEAMQAELERLTTEVAESKTVNLSAIALLNGLAERIRNLEPTREAINKLASDLSGSTDELAAAVTANTPAEPTT